MGRVWRNGLGREAAGQGWECLHGRNDADMVNWGGDYWPEYCTEYWHGYLAVAGRAAAWGLALGAMAGYV